MQKQGSPNQLFLHIKNHKEAVSWMQIIHLESTRNYTIIYLVDGRQILTAKNLGHFEQILPSDFIRINRSFIINQEYIKHSDKRNHVCVLLNDKKIKVATSRWTKVRDLLTKPSH